MTDPTSTWPQVATTVRLLRTGVDMEDLNFVVLLSTSVRACGRCSRQPASSAPRGRTRPPGRGLFARLEFAGLDQDPLAQQVKLTDADPYGAGVDGRRGVRRDRRVADLAGGTAALAVQNSNAT